MKTPVSVMAIFSLFISSVFASAPAPRVVNAVYLKKPTESWINYVSRLGVKVKLYDSNHLNAVNDFSEEGWSGVKSGLNKAILNVHDSKHLANRYYLWHSYQETRSQAMYATLACWAGLKDQVSYPMSLDPGIALLQDQKRDYRIFLSADGKYCDRMTKIEQQAFHAVFPDLKAWQELQREDEASFIAAVARSTGYDNSAPIKSIQIDTSQMYINNQVFPSAVAEEVVALAESYLNDYFMQTMIPLPPENDASRPGKHVFILLSDTEKVNTFCRFLFESYARLLREPSGEINFAKIMSHFTSIEVLGLCFGNPAPYLLASPRYYSSLKDPELYEYYLDIYVKLSNRYAIMLGLGKPTRPQPLAYACSGGAAVAPSTLPASAAASARVDAAEASTAVIVAVPKSPARAVVVRDEAEFEELSAAKATPSSSLTDAMATKQTNKKRTTRAAAAAAAADSSFSDRESKERAAEACEKEGATTRKRRR